MLLLLPFSISRLSILLPQWHLGDPLASHQQTADEVRGNLLGGAGEEGLGEGWEVLEGRGGYGGGLGGEVLRNADSSAVAGLQREYHLPLLAMSEEQLAALFAKLKDDAGLQEKLKGAADLDAALAIAKDAGFDVSKADWLRYQANQTPELSDEELEGISGGTGIGSLRCHSVVIRCV